MSEESAAQAEAELDLDQEPQEAEQAESAPVQAEEADKEDGFQKRINKVTADKYAEKRRADELQRKLDELSSKPAEAKKAPTLEDFDHDEDAYNSALIEHKVEQAVKAQEERSRRLALEAEAKMAQASFNERVVAFNKPDFAEKANAIPQLPAGVADALVQSENGPELIYFLGDHLDEADRIASLSPTQAILELGRLSATLSNKQEIKVSAAPDPIEPLNSGGSISKERGPKGATFE